MEDNTFELLTRMYSEFTTQFREVKDDIKSLKDDVSVLKNDVGVLKSDVSKTAIKLENDISRKIDILFETRHDANKRFDCIEEKIDVLSSKVERQDVEIRVIKARI